MQKCYKCDLQFQDDRVKFCPYCGSPLAVDREWVREQQRKEKERQDRIDEAKRREQFERNAAPYKERADKAIRELSKIKKDGRYYLPFGEYGLTYDRLVNQDALDSLKKKLVIWEDYLAAFYNTSVKSEVTSRLNENLKNDYDLLKTYIEKLKGFRDRSDSYQTLMRVIDAFLFGGKVLLLSTSTDIDDDGITLFDGRRNDSETVSSYSVPSDERRKLIGSNNPDDYVFRRIKVYRYHSESKLYISFPAGGINSKMRDIDALRNKNWGTTYLECLTDIHSLNTILERVTRYVRWETTFTTQKISTMIQNAKLETANIAYDYQKPSESFHHYTYIANRKYR